MHGAGDDCAGMEDWDGRTAVHSLTGRCTDTDSAEALVAVSRRCRAESVAVPMQPPLPCLSQAQPSTWTQARRDMRGVFAALSSTGNAVPPRRPSAGRAAGGVSEGERSAQTSSSSIGHSTRCSGAGVETLSSGPRPPGAMAAPSNARNGHARAPSMSTASVSSLGLGDESRAPASPSAVPMPNPALHSVCVCGVSEGRRPARATAMAAFPVHSLRLPCRPPLTLCLTSPPARSVVFGPRGRRRAVINAHHRPSHGPSISLGLGTADLGERLAALP